MPRCDDRRATFGAVADRLIPAADAMPSAADVVGDDRLRFVLNARPDLVEPLLAALRPELGDDVEARLETLGRDEPSSLGALQLVIVGGYYTDRRPRADRVPGPDGHAARLVEIPRLSRGRADRRGARSRADLARPGHRATSQLPATRGRRSPGTRGGDAMTATRCLDLAGVLRRDWGPGTGAPIEDREPATGRLILTVRGFTPDDVARAAAAAAAAQPAWAATSYQERARILRRAAEIYEAHRDEFGEWTQRETGASHSKMHHESNFAYQEILNAATLPSQAYGSLMPTAVKGRLSIVRRVPVGVVGAITPWNSPSVLGMRVVAPALALGNAVVLKPDPQTPGRRRRDVRGGLPRRRACPTGCSRSSSAAPMSARPS